MKHAVVDMLRGKFRPEHEVRLEILHYENRIEELKRELAKIQKEVEDNQQQLERKKSK